MLSKVRLIVAIFDNAQIPANVAPSGHPHSTANGADCGNRVKDEQLAAVRCEHDRKLDSPLNVENIAAASL